MYLNFNPYQGWESYLKIQIAFSFKFGSYIFKLCPIPILKKVIVGQNNVIVSMILMGVKGDCITGNKVLVVGYQIPPIDYEMVLGQTTHISPKLFA